MFRIKFVEYFVLHKQIVYMSLIKLNKLRKKSIKSFLKIKIILFCEQFCVHKRGFHPQMQFSGNILPLLSIV